MQAYITHENPKIICFLKKKVLMKPENVAVSQ